MYDELIKALRNCTNPNKCCEDCYFFDKCYKSKEYFSIEEQAADAIENTSKAYQMMAEAYEAEVTKHLWIPVTERLPEIDMSYPHHEDYLVQYDSGNMDVASWSNVNWFWTDHVTEPHWNCVQFAEVIAWMPLPQPPEVET